MFIDVHFKRVLIAVGDKTRGVGLSRCAQCNWGRGRGYRIIGNCEEKKITVAFA